MDKIIESESLNKLFFSEWDSQKINEEFALTPYDQRISRVDNVFQEVQRYVEDNGRFWKSVRKNGRMENRLRCCTFMCDFSFLDNQEHNLVPREGIFVADNEERTFHITVMVNPLTECLEIIISYWGVRLICDDKVIYPLIDGLNNRPFVWGKFIFDSDSKKIDYLSKLGYDNCQSVYELLDKHLCRILAYGYTNLNFVNIRAELNFNLTFRDVLPKDTKHSFSLRIRDFFEGEWGFDNCEEYFSFGGQGEWNSRADRTFDEIIEHLEKSSKWFTNISADKSSRKACFSYESKGYTFTGEMTVAIPSESVNLTISTGVVCPKEHKADMCLLLNKLNAKTNIGHFLISEDSNIVLYSLGSFYRSEARNYFLFDEIFCKAMAMPLVFMDSIEEAATKEQL